MQKMTKQQEQIDTLAGNIVNEMFKTFQDASNRGDAFTWEKFPEMMRKLASAYAPMTFYKISGKRLEKVEHEVGQRAFELAEQKVQLEMPKQPSPATSA